MQEKSLSKIKKRKPISVIVHSTNIVGKNLAKILLEQEGKVVLVDQFDSKSKALIQELKPLGEVDFVDIEGLEDLTKNIGRIDYIFYLQSEFLLPSKSFTSKDFLEESNNLNLCLKVAQKYSSKFSLVSSILLNERLSQTQDSQPTAYSSEELQKYSETLAAEYYDKSKVNVRILRIGAVLGNETNIEKFKTLNQLFEDSVSNEAISIEGEGLDIHYLIHSADLTYGILKLTFSSNTHGEVISLCNDNDYTTLSVAYKLLELNPHASEIRFVPSTEKKKVLHSQYIPAPNASKYTWKQRKSLEESFSETLENIYKKYKKKWSMPIEDKKSYRAQLEELRKKKESGMRAGEKKEGHMSTVSTPTGQALTKASEPFKKFSLRDFFKPKSLLKTFGLLILLLPIFYFLLYPALSVAGNTFSIYRSSTNLAEGLSSFDSEFISEELSSVHRSVRNINRDFEKLNWVFQLTNRSEMYDETSKLLHGLETGSEGLVTIAEGMSPLFTYMDEFEPALGFEGGTPTTTREYTGLLEELQRNSDKVGESSYKIAQALEAIGAIETEVYPERLQREILDIQELVKDIDANDIGEVVQFLPEALGVDGRKRYLVLLQNPGELRSTGGWISSYAIIGLEGGQIRELKVDDVYNLDGELKNKEKFFEAQEEMKDALDIEHSGLSLSNWDPHFPRSAREASFFVREAEVASRIDGVLTIDIFLIQDLLDQWGGIDIPGEREIITSDNIHEKVFSLHESFTPGQSQKATFLTTLADEIFKKIFSSDFQENNEVFSVFLNSLDSKNMLVHFENRQASNFFSKKGWTGEISSEDYDFFPFPVEWNWGANKANLYIDRDQKVKVDILNTENVDVEYTLTLRNNSASETYPHGPYENFLRVYLPVNAEVEKIDGFTDDEYSTEKKDGFKILKGWFNIPTSTTKKLDIHYSLKDENIFDVSGDISLETRFFKQPGTKKEDSLSLDITYPNNWAILEEGDFDRARIHLIKDTNLDTEKDILLRWEQQ